MTIMTTTTTTVIVPIVDTSTESPQHCCKDFHIVTHLILTSATWLHSLLLTTTIHCLPPSLGSHINF